MTRFRAASLPPHGRDPAPDDRTATLVRGLETRTATVLEALDRLDERSAEARRVLAEADPRGLSGAAGGEGGAGGDAEVEEQVEQLLEMAVTEAGLRRLADEIASATRRVERLRNMVAPHAPAEAPGVHATLEERPAQDRTRLRQARRAVERARRFTRRSTDAKRR